MEKAVEKVTMLIVYHGRYSEGIFQKGCAFFTSVIIQPA